MQRIEREGMREREKEKKVSVNDLQIGSPRPVHDHWQQHHLCHPLPQNHMQVEDCGHPVAPAVLLHCHLVHQAET